MMRRTLLLTIALCLMPLYSVGCGGTDSEDSRPQPEWWDDEIHSAEEIWSRCQWNAERLFGEDQSTIVGFSSDPIAYRPVDYWGDPPSTFERPTISDEPQWAIIGEVYWNSKDIDANEDEPYAACWMEMTDTDADVIEVYFRESPDLYRTLE